MTVVFVALEADFSFTSGVIQVLIMLAQPSVASCAEEMFVFHEAPEDVLVVEGKRFDGNRAKSFSATVRRWPTKCCPWPCTMGSGTIEELQGALTFSG